MNSTISANHDLAVVIETLPRALLLLPEMSEQLHEADLDLDYIVSIVGRDPALASDMIAAANSNVFVGAEPINTVESVVARLGQRESFRLAGAAIAAQFAQESLAWYGVGEPALRANSLFIALLMEELAPIAQVEPELAFMAGLLRSIGKVVLSRAAMRTASFSPDLREVTALAVWEEENIGYSNPEIGAAVLADWNFPTAVVDAVREHYQPEKSSPPLAHLLNIAAGVADTLRLGFPGESDYWQLALSSLVVTRLTESKIEQATNKVVPEFERLIAALAPREPDRRDRRAA